MGGKKFRIKIQILDNEKESQIKAIFHLASGLGGLGKRVRRGSGAWGISGFEYTLNSLQESIELLNPKLYQINRNDELCYINTKPPDYPFLKSLKLGKEYDCQRELRENIMKIASKLHQKNFNLYKTSLGNAIRKRLASPVFVSMVKSTTDGDKKVLPIVSHLNCNRIFQTHF